MGVSQVNSCPDHLGLCSLLLAFPEWCPATSAPFLPDTLLHILPHSVQKSHSPGSLLQFPPEQLLASPRGSLSYLRCKLVCYISASLTRLWTSGGLGTSLYIFPSPLPDTLTGHVFWVCWMNSCMNKWMHGINVCHWVMKCLQKMHC